MLNNPKLMFVVLLIGQVLLPVSWLRALLKNTSKSLLEWVLDLLVIVFLVSFFFLAGRWDWMSYYLRWVLLGTLAICAFWGIQAVVRNPALSPAIPTRSLDFWVKIGLLVIFVFMTGKALKGHLPDSQKPIDLGFPFKHGVFYVVQGGNDTIINYHYAHPAQKYALDIVKLNSWGLRARGLLPKSPIDYFILGEPIFSPTEGTILEAVDGLEDLNPPDRDPQNPAGNHIVIQPKGTDLYILLAHLQKGSISVKPGEYVKQGQQLGCAGNSGNTSEPHLHIHCATITGEGFVRGGEGVPLTFNEKMLKRNSRICL